MGSKLDRLIHAAPRLLLVFALGAIAVPASVAFAFWGRGSIEHFSWVFLPAVLLGPLSAIGALGLWIYALRSEAAHAKVRLEWAAAALLSIGVVALVLAPSYLAGRVLNYRDIRAARSYCMMLVPRLEAVKQKAGAYPAQLDGLLPDFRPIPRLLSSDGSFYRAVGAGYEFFFADPSGWESGQYYFSEDVAARGHWETWD